MFKESGVYDLPWLKFEWKIFHIFSSKILFKKFYFIKIKDMGHVSGAAVFMKDGPMLGPSASFAREQKIFLF